MDDFSRGKATEPQHRATVYGRSRAQYDVTTNLKFTLIDCDELGNPIQLHPGLGNLPLHPDQDGWSSVLGSWNGTPDDPSPANRVSEVNPENEHAIPAPAIDPPRNVRPSLPRIFCQYPKCSGNSGPHTCAPGRFTCEDPNCSWPGTFKTKQAFNRHYHAMHHNDRVDCPIEGCMRVGAQGIKRADNLAAHMWNKHRMSF